jgi:enamine deaminase RidA (YjgF/YER057c/UK114 family)
MTFSEETESLNMLLEKEHGYSQAVKVGDTIYLAGQVRHDDKGNFIDLSCTVLIASNEIKFSR